MPESFHLTVVTPEAEVLDQPVVYASMPAHDGQVGIQHLRAPLLVKLGHGTMKIELPGNQGTQTFFIGGGFAQVKDDKLTILTDEAVPALDVDAAAAEKDLAEALAMPGTPESAWQQRDRAVTRARALATVARG